MKITMACTLEIRGGRDTYIKPDGSIGTAGKGPLVQWERSGTLGVSQDQTLLVWMENTSSALKETEQDLLTKEMDGQ